MGSCFRSRSDAPGGQPLSLPPIRPPRRPPPSSRSRPPEKRHSAIPTHRDFCNIPPEALPPDSRTRRDPYDSAGGLHQPPRAQSADDAAGAVNDFPGTFERQSRRHLWRKHKKCRLRFSALRASSRDGHCRNRNLERACRLLPAPRAECPAAGARCASSCSRGRSMRRANGTCMSILCRQCCRRCGQCYANASPPAVTGVLDASTQRAVRSLQALFGHEQTGVIDHRFWAYLTRLYTLSAGDGTQSASSGAAPAAKYLL